MPKIRLGAACLGTARRLGRGDAAAPRAVLRNAGVVLAVVAPTIPLHGIFGALISALSVATMLAVVLVVRERAPRAAASASPRTSAAPV